MVEAGITLEPKILDSSSECDSIRINGAYAGMLATTEVGIGSLFHAFNIPFTGYVLSLNQILILSKATKDGGNAASVSSIASILKSLSPMGKKLTPMLAIGMQGILFYLGCILGKNTLFGRCLGACFSATWGFIQPIALYYLIFGSVLFESIFQYIPQSYFYTLLTIFISFKCLLGIAIVFASSTISSAWWERFIKVKKWNFSKPNKPNFFTVAIKALKDLMNFPFVLSIALTSAYLYVLDGPNFLLFFYLLRTIAIGYLFFFLMRILPLSRILPWLEKKPWKFTKTLKEAIKEIAD